MKAQLSILLAQLRAQNVPLVHNIIDVPLVTSNIRLGPLDHQPQTFLFLLRLLDLASQISHLLGVDCNSTFEAFLLLLHLPMNCKTNGRVRETPYSRTELNEPPPGGLDKFTRQNAVRTVPMI